MLMEQEFPAHSLMKIENEIQVKRISLIKRKIVNIIFFSIKKML